MRGGGGGGVGGRGSDKRPPTLSNCYCYLTSPFFTRKSVAKLFAFHFRGSDRT